MPARYLFTNEVNLQQCVCLINCTSTGNPRFVAKVTKKETMAPSNEKAEEQVKTSAITYLKYWGGAYCIHSIVIHS